MPADPPPDEDSTAESPDPPRDDGAPTEAAAVPALVAEVERAVETGHRPLGLALIVAGLAHLLAPRALLWSARLGYRTVLRARFRPGERSPRRVRLLGVAMVAAGAHLLYYGGLRP